MSQSHPSPQRVESITDLTHDLDLLFPNGYGPVSSMVEGTQMRQIKIQELKRTCGTLPQVGSIIIVALSDTDNVSLCCFYNLSYCASQIYLPSIYCNSRQCKYAKKTHIRNIDSLKFKLALLYYQRKLEKLQVQIKPSFRTSEPGL